MTEQAAPTQEEATGAPAPELETLDKTIDAAIAAREAVAEAAAPEPDPAIAEPAVTVDAPPPTFSEQLQAAISRFSADVGSLKSLELTVGQAEEEVTSAQRALTDAETSQGLKLADRASGRTAAVDSRDGLIAVLQSWSP